MELKSWMVLILIMFVVPFMTARMRKPYASMMRKKESLESELEYKIDQLRGYELELDKEDRKPIAEFQEELDRLTARYEKYIKELREDHNSDTLNEILVMMTFLTCTVVGYVIYAILDHVSL